MESGKNCSSESNSTTEIASEEPRNSSHTAWEKNVIGIDHIGVAVTDLGAAVQWAVSLLGCKIVEERDTKGVRAGMKSVVLRLGGVVIVLVEGVGENSQVSQFVKNYGPGVQHIAIRVDDLDQTISTLQSSQFSFATPRLDGDGLSQIFSTRDERTGLMLEFIERRNYEGFSDENVQKLFHSLEEKGLY